MKNFLLLAIAALLLPVAAEAHMTSSAWVQMMPGGGAEIRAVINGPCPYVVFDADADGESGRWDVQDATHIRMVARVAEDKNFPTVCSLPIPKGVKSVSVAARDTGEPAMVYLAKFPVPVADPQRILVLGDTGCRIKGDFVQACNDPKAWPFAHLAQAAANLHPDLVIHLGDYLYRETPCPAGNAGCAGSPHGDNWAAWDADFFTPAAPLLAAAPWIIIRGNHEDCSRAGPGFLRLLGPTAFDPAAPCNAHLDPYAIPIGRQTVAVMDSASAADYPLDKASVPIYAKDFALLKAMSQVGEGRELWLATHRPLWAATTVMGAPAGGNATMITAAGDLSAFKAISLMLAGHIHIFEAINYDGKNIPPQIVAGHGGDTLDTAPKDLRGTTFDIDAGVHVKTGISVGGFGFLLLTRESGNEGWTVQLYDSDGNPIKQCAYAGRALFCLDAR